jgi:small subunit ribosomal protein S15
MPLDKETLADIANPFRSHKSDTGSMEVQIAVLTAKIEKLTQHLKAHTKDFSSTRGLLMLVGQRRRFLRHIKQKDVNRFNDITDKLNLRKTN